MAGSSLGEIFKISTWGESHGEALGVVVDGCPAGLEIDESYIQKELNRRKPGQSKYTTPRKESDRVQILSGIFEGKTTGTPISLVVFNENQRSRDYSNIKDVYRPGHADLVFDEKYGFRDYRGGGRSSGRETVSRVAAGAIAKKILESIGTKITTYTKSIGPITIDSFDENEINNNMLYMPDKIAAEDAKAYLQQLIKEHNSCGGTIECIVKNSPIGLGDPVFDKCDANIGKALMSVGSVKGVEIGSGFEVATLTGYDNNDFYTASNSEYTKLSNHAGGILGGITDGSDIVIRTAIKPTPSIGKTQQTINKSNEEVNINIEGRHDPIIVPRAVVVIESMVAITLTDLLLKNMSATMDNVLKIYN